MRRQCYVKIKTHKRRLGGVKWLSVTCEEKVIKPLFGGKSHQTGHVSSKLRPGGVASGAAGWQNLPKRTLTKADNFLLLW